MPSDHTLKLALDSMKERQDTNRTTTVSTCIVTKQKLRVVWERRAIAAKRKSKKAPFVTRVTG